MSILVQYFSLIEMRPAKHTTNVGDHGCIARVLSIGIVLENRLN